MKTTLTYKYNQPILYYFNFILIFFGIAFPVIQYIYNRSLWLDEAYLVQSFSRSYQGLLEPLEAAQVAPILFLLTVKFFSTIIPNSEYGLRIFQLICYLASFYFFYQLINILIKNSLARIFSITLFVFNSNLIYYSSELKQYIIDVLIIVLIYYILLRSYKNQKNRYFLLAIIGVLAIGFSNVTPLILSTVGVYLIIEGLRKMNFQLNILSPIFILWLVAFASYYLQFIHEHPARDYMISWWSNKNAFLPLNFFSEEFVLFIAKKFTMTFRGLLAMGYATMFPLAILFTLGIIYIYRSNKYKLLILILFPIILHLGLSSLKMYPFFLRLLLYLIPLLILALGLGFEYIMLILKRNFQSINFNKYFLYLFPVFWTIIFLKIYYNGFPIKREEIKDSLVYLHDNSKIDDQLIIHNPASVAYDYYLKSGFIKHNLSTYVGEHDLVVPKFASLITTNKGRVWVLFTHDFNYEIGQILNFLKSRNITPIESFNSYNSSLYLFEIH